MSGLIRCVLPTRSCGADLEDRQCVFRTLWRVHRRWSLAIPAELRTPLSHEIVLSTTTSAWLRKCPRTFLLPFHCLLCPVEARHLPYCDVETCEGSLSTRHEKVYGIVVYIRDPKTRGMACHAAQQLMLLDCPGISQLVNTMISSIPDHRHDAAIWTCTATQHFAYSNDNSATSACQINVTWATDVEAVELPMICFNSGTYHNYDAEVGGRLKPNICAKKITDVRLKLIPKQ